MLVPEDIEEERRLCYVGMTRAMDQLILTRAVYRRRYGTDLPEASVPSRFLEEVPAPLLEELGNRKSSSARVGTGAFARPTGRSAAATESTHYSSEDEAQSASWHSGEAGRASAPAREAYTAGARLQLDREHRRVFREPRQEVHASKDSSRRAHRQARVPSGAEGSPSEIR